MANGTCRVCGGGINHTGVRGRPRLTHAACLPIRSSTGKRHDGRSRAECLACGETFKRKELTQRTCSRWCGHLIRYGEWPRSNVPTRHPSRRPAPEGHSVRVFISDCAVCQRCFVSPYTIKTCGARCTEAKRLSDKRDHRHRHRARKRGAFVLPVYRLKVYERDGWRCQLCGGRVARSKTAPHPKSPTIDHIIPLARGGTHEPSNVQCAHFLCNARKGSRLAGDQLRLIG